MDIKITGAYSQYLAPPVKGQHHQASQVNATRPLSDKVSLSSQAEDYNTAMRAMQITPDLRQDLVNSLSEMISKGAYNISAQDVAAKIFQGLED